MTPTISPVAPVELSSLMAAARADGVDIRVGRFGGQPLDTASFPKDAVLVDVQEDSSGKLWAHGLA